VPVLFIYIFLFVLICFREAAFYQIVHWLPLALTLISLNVGVQGTSRRAPLAGRQSQYGQLSLGKFTVIIFTPILSFVQILFLPRSFSIFFPPNFFLFFLRKFFAQKIFFKKQLFLVGKKNSKRIGMSRFF